MPFSLPNLPFDPGALEPFIDAETMRIHHGKHHATYVSKLNDSIKGTDKDRLSLEDLIGHHHSTAAIRNNGGGHWNHSLFWTLLDPERRAYDGEFGEALDQSFGGFDGFKASFSKEALARFGSGWVWLVKGADGALSVCSTPNQDNPLMEGSPGFGSRPVLALDVWEHAYYLKYQNRRPEYVEAFFKIVNWKEAGRLFTQG